VVAGRPIHQLVLKWSLFLSNILTELTLMQGISYLFIALLFDPPPPFPFFQQQKVSNNLGCYFSGLRLYSATRWKSN